MLFSLLRPKATIFDQKNQWKTAQSPSETEGGPGFPLLVLKMLQQRLGRHHPDLGDLQLLQVAL